ncbi:MAG: hypothetical protein U0166_01145 [Acidobacteriota bacterium]
MFHRALFVSMLLVSMIVSGCSGSSPKEASPGGDKAGAGGKPKAKAEAEAKNVVPGSYEDWCEEHQVPETQCTRCNASLIPAFKATGDWCETHQLPKSHDLADNPDLKIVRPPKPEGGA